MKKVKCVQANHGCEPPCLRGEVYEFVDEFSYGPVNYFRIRFANGTETDVDRRDFVVLEGDETSTSPQAQMFE